VEKGLVGDDPARANESRAPVAGIESLDPHNSLRAWCVHELATTNRNCHMRGAWLCRREEDQISRAQMFPVNGTSHHRLRSNLTRQMDPVLGKYELRESTAVEAAAIDSALSVGQAAESQGRSRQRQPAGILTPD
jgi:hypothetical protein